MTPFTDVTIENIRAGKLTEQFPEFYALQNVIENNAGHINDSVFNHCVKTADKMSGLLRNLPEIAASMLQEKIGGQTRSALLLFAAFLHDIGKQSMTPNARGEFIGHEQIGAWLVRDVILKRIDLSTEAQAHIVAIVENHGLMHAVSNDEKNIDLNFAKAVEQFSYICLELVLLVLADLEGGDLATLNPAVYNFKTSYFKQVLNQWKEYL